MKGQGHSTEEQLTRVILVLTLPPTERHLLKDREEEMRSLLTTADCEVVGVAAQHLARPINSTYIGSGKIEEIRQLCVTHEADEVIFDTQLSPSQERNIEKLVCTRVVDYAGLILHIFANNARTHQAKMAVEVAQLEYNRSRLKRLWTHLDRIKAGTNMRGPGEKQLEVDRRLVNDRIREIKTKLKEFEERKERTIASRKEAFKVCLVGYTNAGKSSLMNALTDADVLAQDKLFATLDTRTSKMHIDDQHHVVLSDTVGFIRKLPPNLIASFHATLAEAIEADLLLHVVDASLPSMEEQVSAVEEVLETIGAQDVPTLMVFNKVDKPHSKTILLAFKKHYKGSVKVSAHSGEGLDDLRQAILKAADKGKHTIVVRFSIADGATDAFIRRSAKVLDEHYDNEHTALTIEVDDQLYHELKNNERLDVADASQTA